MEDRTDEERKREKERQRERERAGGIRIHLYGDGTAVILLALIVLDLRRRGASSCCSDLVERLGVVGEEGVRTARRKGGKGS